MQTASGLKTNVAAFRKSAYCNETAAQMIRNQECGSFW